jgi:hypothetical protein
MIKSTDCKTLITDICLSTFSEKTCQQYNKYNNSDNERDKIDIKIPLNSCISF